MSLLIPRFPGCDDFVVEDPSGQQATEEPPQGLAEAHKPAPSSTLRLRLPRFLRALTCVLHHRNQRDYMCAVLLLLVRRRVAAFCVPIREPGSSAQRAEYDLLGSNGPYEASAQV